MAVLCFESLAQFAIRAIKKKGSDIQQPRITGLTALSIAIDRKRAASS
jgi:hypothetical protein